MKTSTILVMSVLLCTSLRTIGQITISQNDLPAVGNSKLINSAIDLNADYTTTGANQTWDFSTLEPQSQSNRSYSAVSSGGFLITFTFGPMAGNYAASFLTPAVDFDLSQFTSFLPVEIDNINQFYKKSATSYNTVGYSVEVSGQGIPVKSDTIEQRYVLPLNFGDSYNSRGYTYLNTAPIYTAELKQYRQRSSTVDGHGTVNTPMGTFQALRVKHQIMEQDSVNLTGTWMGFNQPTKFEYEWLAAGQGEPVLKISTRIVAGVEVVSSVEYLTDQPLAVEQLSANSMQFYPNPVQDKVTVQTDKTIDDLTIIDVNGRVVSRLTNVVSGTSIDFSAFTSGVYQLVGVSDGGTQIQRVVKQ